LLTLSSIPFPELCSTAIFFNEMQIWTAIWQIFCLQNLAMLVGSGFITFKGVWTASSFMGKQDKCFEWLAVSFPHILSIFWYICLAIFPNLKQDLKHKHSSISASSQSHWNTSIQNGIFLLQKLSYKVFLTMSVAWNSHCVIYILAMKSSQMFRTNISLTFLLATN
jgi:hypothetical protein